MMGIGILGNLGKLEELGNRSGFFIVPNVENVANSLSGLHFYSE